MVTRVARPERAFGGLEADREPFDGARDLVEGDTPPLQERRRRRFVGGLVAIDKYHGVGGFDRRGRGRGSADAFNRVSQETASLAARAAHAARSEVTAA